MKVQNGDKIYEIVWKGKKLQDLAVVHVYEESQMYYKYFGVFRIKKQRNPVWISYGMHEPKKVCEAKKLWPTDMNNWLLWTFDEYIQHKMAWEKYERYENSNLYENLSNAGG